MNYYYDTEFLEGTQDKRFLGFKYGTTAPTIDLISIGIISEDGREYYAISKDFNLKEAWNRFDLEIQSGDMRNIFPEGRKVYWIRENVLKPIYTDLLIKDYSKKLFISEGTSEYRRLEEMFYDSKIYTFTLNDFKRLLFKYGKSNKQIAQEVFEFCTGDIITIEKAKHYNIKYDNINLYGYYSAYDHVALCWLFGKMMDLPKGFPMYTVDLKQMMDEKAENYSDHFSSGNESFETKLSWIKNKDNYPKQENEHNALADARWNKKLHEFLIQVN